MITISVVKTVLNSKKTVGHALISIFSQTHRQVESVLIDGASTDGTLEVLHLYQSKIGVFI